jgi:hypothetical protein
MLSPAPFVRFARPNPESNESDYAPPGLPGVWADKYAIEGEYEEEFFRGGFYARSTDPSSYNLNFPTTGMNGLHFYLDVAGVDPSTLNWPSVTHGGITASMDVIPKPTDQSWDYWGDFVISNQYMWVGGVRVTLTGPTATREQRISNTPGSVTKPTLPQTFEIVGYNSRGDAVIKYGFVLNKWFVYRDYVSGSHKLTDFEQPIQAAWCDSIGYRVPRVKDLTNSKCDDEPYFPCGLGIDSAIPHSPNLYAQRNIGPFVSEWGYMEGYWVLSLGLLKVWTSDSALSASGKREYFTVGPEGKVHYDYNDNGYFNRNDAICVHP